MGAKDIMLAIHIFCGFVALVTMVMAYVTKKGPKFHAKVGRVYGLSMVGVGLTVDHSLLFGSLNILASHCILLSVFGACRLEIRLKQERRSQPS